MQRGSRLFCAKRSPSMSRSIPSMPTRRRLRELPKSSHEFAKAQFGWQYTKEQIVATGSLVPEPEGSYIRGMAVIPSARGLGIGRRLLDEIQRFATAQGCARLFLSTTPFLSTAIRLYEAFGFRRMNDGPHGLFGTTLFTMEKTVALAIEEEHRPNLSNTAGGILHTPTTR